MIRNIVVLAIALGGILAVAGWGAWELWVAFGVAEISIHGVIALVAGVVLTLGIGGGLMALVFYSSRRGYDDEVM